jgi:hypothetical protein
MGGMPPGGFRGGPPPPMPFTRGGYGGANLAPPIFTPHMVVRKVTADDMYKKEIEAAEKRSALQLAFVYMCDHNKPLGQFLDGLETNIITIVSNSAEDRVRSYFEANVVKHQLLNVEQFRNTDLQAKVSLKICKNHHTYMYEIYDFLASFIGCFLFIEQKQKFEKISLIIYLC